MGQEYRDRYRLIDHGQPDTNPLRYMSSQTSILGRCPHCGETIGEHDVLISYERDTDTEHYAECPSCEAVVHPTAI